MRCSRVERSSHAGPPLDDTSKVLCERAAVPTAPFGMTSSSYLVDADVEVHHHLLLTRHVRPHRCDVVLVPLELDLHGQIGRPHLGPGVLGWEAGAGAFALDDRPAEEPFVELGQADGVVRVELYVIFSGATRPMVPMLAALCPKAAKSWREKSTTELLPAVPVTATMVSG